MDTIKTVVGYCLTAYEYMRDEEKPNFHIHSRRIPSAHID